MSTKRISRLATVRFSTNFEKCIVHLCGGAKSVIQRISDSFKGSFYHSLSRTPFFRFYSTLYWINLLYSIYAYIWYAMPMICTETESFCTKDFIGHIPWRYSLCVHFEKRVWFDFASFVCGSCAIQWTLTHMISTRAYKTTHRIGIRIHTHKEIWNTCSWNLCVTFLLNMREIRSCLSHRYVYASCYEFDKLNLCSISIRLHRLSF